MSEKSEWKPILKKWWDELEEDRGGRAKLRRCQFPLDVMLVPVFHKLLNDLKKTEKWHNLKIPAFLAIAGLVSHVKTDVPTKGEKYISFARQLGSSQDDKPALSETRFYQLIKSRSLDDLYHHTRQSIKMLDCNVNMLSLADCVLEWDKENRGDFERELRNRFQFKMAHDYFSEIIKEEEAE